MWGGFWGLITECSSDGSLSYESQMLSLNLFYLFVSLFHFSISSSSFLMDFYASGLVCDFKIDWGENICSAAKCDVATGTGMI